MQPAMLQLRKMVNDMIEHGGTEEDLFAVIGHIDNWALELETAQLLNAYNDGKKSVLAKEEMFWDEYYNRKYNDKNV